jgi:hypothetical protein
VSARAWADLNHDPPVEEPPIDAAKKLPILRKFYEYYSDASRVDDGVALSSVADSKVFRIKAGDWRAAVRYMPDDGVVWMCRVLALAKYSEEARAYAKLGKLHEDGLLLPTDEERRLARADQFLVSAVAAFAQARVNADNEPDRWWDADARRPNETLHHVGRVYVERELDEGQGEYITRFLLLVATAPDDVRLRHDWKEFVTSRAFPGDEPIQMTYELPAGTNLQQNELPFMQEAFEFLDEEGG